MPHPIESSRTIESEKTNNLKVKRQTILDLMINCLI